MAIRLLDILLSLILFVFTLPILLIALTITLLDLGHPIFVQQRLGKDGVRFKIYKIRTMAIGTKQRATHLIATESVSKIGRIIRKFKIDELPQLVNVFLGDMSLVGPRPNLVTQSELIELRKRNNIYSIKPGITGLAQVMGVDMSDIHRLVRI